MRDEVRARWGGALLVCGKCSKKLGGGFGRKGKRSLARALRDEPGLGKGRKAALGVVEVRCLGVCPRGAVTLVDTRAPDRWRLVEAGADVATLAAGLRGEG
ncbi:(2Fe-2S) ferredoxin domain-containing protein [Sphingomonas sp. RRHST34]|uniref:(2Fe-2S) ferredoxin domain-containing protein n=1 Tax=Sphingomonas citri TaxID=2862499 RepID=A0ABS7BI50_9SPHN|nr:(2Fe-2S) ferredoxin domain-containing protein [Sphingomonas citri]MBW6529210.1 (2Fe-2S) ferredoxin domain-containing protein [Sphingomonas citri]